ncbi:MAG: hypothetical protein IJW49_00070 [Clostridia bacterium]|nr:hypothetical protein [Clostridia bacterium]
MKGLFCGKYETFVEYLKVEHPDFESYSPEKLYDVWSNVPVIVDDCEASE